MAARMPPPAFLLPAAMAIACRPRPVRPRSPRSPPPPLGRAGSLADRHTAQPDDPDRIIELWWAPRAVPLVYDGRIGQPRPATCSPVQTVGGGHPLAAVVFMRGVNVGGRRPLRPATLAKKLSAFDVVNIGAAGTFVVREAMTPADLRAELRERLPGDFEFMICRGRDLMDLLSAEPFPPEASGRGVRRFVSVLAGRPIATPAFPVSHPARRAWRVKVVGLRGKSALSRWRRTGQAMVYPNEVVEKHLAVPATTRTWDTISRIHDLLGDGRR